MIQSMSLILLWHYQNTDIHCRFSPLGDLSIDHLQFSNGQAFKSHSSIMYSIYLEIPYLAFVVSKDFQIRYPFLAIAVFVIAHGSYFPAKHGPNTQFGHNLSSTHDPSITRSLPISPAPSPPLPAEEQVERCEKRS